jgi:ATP-dependent Clp protease, protease subunit
MKIQTIKLLNCQECEEPEQNQETPPTPEEMLNQQTILLIPSGSIDSQTFAQFIAQIKFLEAQNPKFIQIILNSGGGDIYAGLAIYDAIMECKVPVVIKTYGQCMSAAMLIMQAGDLRVSAPNCTFMMHYGTTGYQGNTLDFQKWGNESHRACQLMEEILAERFKGKDKIKKIKKMLESDTIISPETAKKLGLIDKIG